MEKEPKKLTVKCITKDKDGVILKLELSDGKPYTKSQVIKMINSKDYEVYVGTTIVEVVEDKYLRTKGNTSKQDNLSGVSDCK